MMCEHQVVWIPAPSGFHSRYVLQSLYGIIRSIFSRLVDDDDFHSFSELSVLNAIQISKDVCRSKVVLDSEMAKGFTDTISGLSLFWKARGCAVYLSNNQFYSILTKIDLNSMKLPITLFTN